MAKTKKKVAKKKNDKVKYMKVAVLTKFKLFCNRVMFKIEAWIKSTNV